MAHDTLRSREKNEGNREVRFLPQNQQRNISEKSYIRNSLNLEAETLAQLRTALSSDGFDWDREGIASNNARLDYIRERLRLFYVGITRAKREVIVTWNNGKKSNLESSIPFKALQSFQIEKFINTSR